MSTDPDPNATQDESAALLAAVLADSHPLMVEAFCIAALAYRFDLPLFSAVRDRDDGRDAGLVERLKPYSFVIPLAYEAEAGPAFVVRSREREALNRRWIEQDGAAYCAAHGRALVHWEAHPDSNPFAQAQHRVYHGLLVEDRFDTAVALLIGQFRTYRNERQFAAIERLLGVGREAQGYLALLGRKDRVSQLGDLLGYLDLRLAQLREDWDRAGRLLEALQARPSLDPRLMPYSLRAQGLQLQGQKQYVDAIEKLKGALNAFDDELRHVGKVTLFQPENDLRAERAYTLLDLGRAHVDLANSVRGERPWESPRTGVGRWVRAGSSLLASLPLVLYLAAHLGRAVWSPSFWAALPGLDWIIARLYGVGARYYRRADADLERYGQPAEGTVADESLADLYLALGHAREAELLYRPLAQESALVGPYRRATAQVSLAKAWLRQGRPEPAAEVLPAALSALEPYGDRDLEARAGELLGEALLFTGQPAKGVNLLAASCRRYQESEAWVQATGLVERLQGWIRSGRLAGDAQAGAQQVIDGLPLRQYPGRYRHPLLVGFRRFMLLMLPIVLLLAPLLTIKLGTGVALVPEIHFRPEPIMDPNIQVALSLSQGVVRADISQVEVSNMLLWAAGGLVLAYLVLSFGLGLAAIALTPLGSVQKRGRGATVCLDGERITLGSESTGCREGQSGADPPQQVVWKDATQFVQADTCLWRAPMADASAVGVAAGAAPVVIPASTAWYGSLCERMRRLKPESARTTNLSYSILRSPLGVLYLLNLAFLGVLGVLAAVQSKGLIFQRLPGNSYSLVDLYPYFYLFLVVAPLWWAVVQPLRRRLVLQPRSRLPLIVLGAGLVLVLAEVLLRFRPLLMALDVYVPLAALILLVSGEVAVWRARQAGRPVYPTVLRLATAALAGAACLLMVTLLWRDVWAYHYLVQGNWLRDEAMQSQKTKSSEETELASWQAVPSYKLATELGRQPVWGVTTQAAARIRVGVPPARSLTWLSALTNEAALETQLGRYPDATQLYSQTLDYTDQPDQVYAWLAVIRLSQGTQAPSQQGVQVNANQYEEAIRLLDKAIELNPRRANYFLWRGVAYHALVKSSDCTISPPPGVENPLVEARDSYSQALAMRKRDDVALKAPERERAHTGLGWLAYLCGDHGEALSQFQLASITYSSSEAWLARGYAHYALGSFAEAQASWEEAARLDPRDPAIVISLGSCHWKLGGQAGEALGRDPCIEYQTSAAYFGQATRRDEFWQQSDKEVARSYRTLGYVQSLVGGACPQPGKVAMYQAAVDSFTQALSLDPGRLEYWFRRGRFEYSVALLMHQQGRTDIQPWLERSMADLAQAATIAPGRPYHPHHDRAWVAYDAWSWIEPKTPATAAWLLQAVTDLEAAREQVPEDINRAYRPNYWMGVIRPKAIGGNLERGDASLEAGDAQTALEYYRLVAEFDSLDPRETVSATMKVGLAYLVLGEPDNAASWYWSGLKTAQAAGQTLPAQQALMELLIRSSKLNLDAQPIVDLFREKGIVLEAAGPAAAFDLALNALRLGDTDTAKHWVLFGLDLAKEQDDASAPQEALAALYLEVLSNPALPAGKIVPLFQSAGVSLEPDTAQLSFDLARSALIQGNLAGSADLYNRGVELAAGVADIKVVRSAANALLGYLLAHPEVSPTDAYWPLHDDLAARQIAVAGLARPDLYWRYRAEFGFYLVRDRQLMRVEPGGVEVAEQIYISLAGDVERAYALNPTEHQTWRDFYVDANVGWLYLRRGDDYAKEGNYEQALADYEQAAQRIQPKSKNAALDLTDDLFRAGLTALRLGQPDRAAGWYAEGVALVENQGARFGLGVKIQPAIDDLNKLLEEQPALAPAIQPIVDQLKGLLPGP